MRVTKIAPTLHRIAARRSHMVEGFTGPARLWVESGSLLVAEYGEQWVSPVTLRHGNIIKLDAGVDYHIGAIEPCIFFWSGKTPPTNEKRGESASFWKLAEGVPYSVEHYGESYFTGDGSCGFLQGQQTYAELKPETDKKIVRLLSDSRTKHRSSFYEVGCSLGYVTHDLIEAGKDAKGCDISPFAIANAYGSAKGHVYVGNPSDGLPEPDKSFDVVHSWDVVEHIPIEQLPAAMDEMARITRHILLVRTPLRSHKNRQAPYDWTVGEGEGHDPTHVACMPEDFWCDEFERRGLLCDSVENWHGGTWKAEGWLWFRRR